MHRSLILRNFPPFIMLTVVRAFLHTFYSDVRAKNRPLDRIIPWNIIQICGKRNTRMRLGKTTKRKDGYVINSLVGKVFPRRRRPSATSHDGVHFLSVCAVCCHANFSEISLSISEISRFFLSYMLQHDNYIL